MILNEIKKLNERRPKRDQAKQLITHLKNLGFNVFGREAMEKFLKEHNLQDLQQAIAEQKEMDTIKQKAIADGTFMKAPNGKPTNLNERQWLQVRTTNFKNWFGDWENNPEEASKVVDENGEPLVVYHGSTAYFTEFNYKDDREYSDGFYFTSDANYAKTIASKKGQPIIMPVFLNIKTPIITETPFVQGRMEGIYVQEGRQNSDGIMGHDLDTFLTEGINPSKGTEYHVVRPNQIKSATNNNGDFSRTNDDIQAFVDKYNLPEGEFSSLFSALMTKYGNKTAYGDVIHTANYEYTVNYKGAGEFDIIEYHKIDNNLNTEYNDRENEGFSECADEGAIQNEVTKGKYNSDSYHVANREANGDNVGLDKQTSQGESNQTSSDVSSNQHQEWRSVKRDSATGRISFVEGDGRTNSTIEDWRSIEIFTTPQGEVFGFVDKEGNTYSSFSRYNRA